MTVVKGVSLTDNQTAVLDVIRQYGPIADHALVPLAQHQMQVHQSSSGIRTRRSELALHGLVVEVATSKTGSGRTARVWAVA